MAGRATMDRWQAALRRAFAEGCQLYQLAGTGERVVSSGSRPALAYRTNGHPCECEAAMLGGDPVCRHRALYSDRQGGLALDSAPDAPVARGGGLSAAEMICLKADAMKRHCLHGEPLVNPFMGEVIADAA